MIDTDPSFGPRAIDRYLYPYSGPLPGAQPRYVGGLGRMAASSSRSLRVADYETRPIAPMAGFQPIGLAGPDDGWMAFSAGYIGWRNVAYLYSGMVPAGYGGISLVPLRRPPEPTGALQRSSSATPSSSASPGTEVTQLLAVADGFEVVVGAPVGTWVTAWDGRGVDEADHHRRTRWRSRSLRPVGAQRGREPGFSASLVLS